MTCEFQQFRSYFKTFVNGCDSERFPPMRHRFRLFSLSVFLLALHAGCVTPPPPPNSSVLDPNEREVLQSTRRGKDYLSSGRVDQAEAEFRHVLAISPPTTTVLSDLGYVFERQERYPDAAAAYRRSLQLNSKNVVAREGLARVFAATGKTEAGIDELLTASEQLAVYTDERIRQITGRTYSAADKRSVLRTLAGAYYKAGYEDEALCFTRRALAMGDIDWSLVSYYARLLLVTGRFGVAGGYLKDVIGVWQENAPSSIYLDFGIAAYAMGDRATARDALQKVLERKNADANDRHDAGLLQLAVVKAAGTAADIAALKTGLLADDTLCDTAAPNRGDYWPDSVDADAKNSLRELCGKERPNV